MKRVSPLGLTLGRSGETRTRGIHIPNVARYQLRYTPFSAFLLYPICRRLSILSRPLFSFCRPLVIMETTRRITRCAHAKGIRR